MNKSLKKFFLTIALFFCFAMSYAQGIINDVASAVGTGNVGGISKYLDNAVAVTIQGNQSTYSHSQAEMVLRDFFSKNAAKGFSMERNGGGNNNSYAIGTLTTSNGNYRAYIALRQKNGAFVIQEIRFEK
jgi:hypothetical protein